MRRRLAVLLAVALTAPLAGCGDDPAEEGPLAAAAEQSANEKSARWYMEMDADTKAEGEFKAVGTATAASDNSRLHMNMRLTLAGERPIRMEMINIRDDFWMRSPAFDLPRGKRWMHSVDRSAAPSTMTMREFLDLIRESGDVEELGGERVRGRATTRYRAKVKLDDLFERSPQETQDRFREKFEQLEGKGVVLPLEVLVDDEGLVRRLMMEFEGGGERIDLEMDVLEYGVNVPAAPPSADVVIEESDLAG